MKGIGFSSPFTPKKPNDGSPADERPHRRRSRSCSSASSPSSFAAMSCPSPSPAHHLHSVPFSWEQQPGVPKNYPTRKPKSHPSDPRLPLPPPSRSKSTTSIPSRKRPESRSAAADPFAAALAECAKDPPAAVDRELEELWRTGGKAAAGRRGAIATAVGGRRAIADLFGSCKAVCSVAESTIRIPRPGVGAGTYGFLLNRRAG